MSRIEGVGRDYIVADFNTRHFYMGHRGGVVKMSSSARRAWRFVHIGLARRAMAELKQKFPDGDWEALSEAAAWALERYGRKEAAARGNAADTQ